MRFSFVGTRKGKPAVNLSFTLIVGFLSAVICTGIALLIGVVAPESAIVDTVGWAVSFLPPLLIVMMGVLRGLKTPPDQLPKLD